MGPLSDWSRQLSVLRSVRAKGCCWPHSDIQVSRLLPAELMASSCGGHKAAA